MSSVAASVRNVPLFQAELADLRRAGVVPRTGVRGLLLLHLDQPDCRGRPLLDVRRSGDQHGVSPAAHASRVQDTEAVRVFPGGLRHADARGRPDLLGGRPPPAPSAFGRTARPAYAARQRVLVAHRLDYLRRGPPQRHGAHVALRARPRARPLLSVVDDVSLGAVDGAGIHPARHRWMAARQLGDLPARGGRPPRDVARQLRHASVGTPPLRHRRRLEELVVGRAADVRRRLAQQSPRPPGFGPSRPGVVRVRPHLALAAAPPGASGSSGTSKPPR